MKSENLFTENCIRTFTGQYVNVFDTDPDTILIEDIAHALAHLPRFGGHLPYFYSVAQHSVYVSRKLLGTSYAFEGLMHDATEAYLMDFPKPIKENIPEYKQIENKLYRVIAKKFGLRPVISEEVHSVDKEALVYEWEKLMLRGSNRTWRNPFEGPKRDFLQMYETLKSLSHVKL